MSYGVFAFRLSRWRVAKAPGCIVADGIMAAERGRFWLRPLPDMVIRSTAGGDRTGGDIAGSAVAAWRIGSEPCRIMVGSSGSMVRAAERGAAASVRRPPSRPSAHRSKARRSRVRELFGRVVLGRRCDRQQPAGKRKAV